MQSMKVSKFGAGTLTSTPREILKNGGNAMQNQINDYCMAWLLTLDIRSKIFK
jgi:hypothetical protein